MPVRVHNVQQAHDVRVIQLLQQGDLADGGGWYTLIFGLEANLLERDNALVGGGEVAGFVDDAVCAWRCI